MLSGFGPEGLDRALALVQVTAQRMNAASSAVDADGDRSKSRGRIDPLLDGIGQGRQEFACGLPGEPVTPMLRAVLEAADRPLSSSDAAPALLKARGLEYRDREVAAIVTRMSALLVQEAKTGRVGRAPTDDKRRPLLIWTRRTTEEPRDAAAIDRSPDLARDGT